MKKPFGVFAAVLAVTAMLFAYAESSRNVVRERDYERLRDRGPKDKAPDPAFSEEDIAVPKPAPVATCADDVCTEHCRSSASECEAFMKKTCQDKHPLPPGSVAVQFRQVSSFKLGVECAFFCPTASGSIEEFECLTQREIDARKKRRPKPQTLPPADPPSEGWRP